MSHCPKRHWLRALFSSLTQRARRKRRTPSSFPPRFLPRVEALEHRVLLAYNTVISAAATSNVSLVESGTAANFSPTGTGANVAVSAILAELQKSSINTVIVTTGGAGGETGNLTWQAGANLDIASIGAAKTLILQADPSGPSGTVSLASNLTDSNPGSETLALTVQSQGSITLSGSVNTNGANVWLTSVSGSIAESGSSTITANTLTTDAATGVTLNNTNGVNSYYAANTTSGDITLVNAESYFTAWTIREAGTGNINLTNTGEMVLVNAATAGGNITLATNSGPLLTGNLTAGAGAVSLSAAGNLTIAGLVSSTNGPVTGTAGGTIIIAAYGGTQTAGDVTLTAANGSIQEGTYTYSSGSINAGLLTTVSAYGTALKTLNAVSSFNATNSTSGDITLLNAAPLPTYHNLYNALTITGITQSGSGNVNITDSGAILVTGALTTAAGNINLESDLFELTSAPVTAGGAGAVTMTGTQIGVYFQANIASTSGPIALTGGPYIEGYYGAAIQTGGAVTLTAQGGSILWYHPAPGSGVQAPLLTMDALQSIYPGLSSVVSSLNANAGARGGINFNDNAALLTITGIVGGATIANTGAITTTGAVNALDSSVQLTAGGTLTVGAAITSTNPVVNQTAVELTANGSTSDIVLNGPVSSSTGSADGDLVLTAGRNIILNAGGLATAGTATLTASAGAISETGAGTIQAGSLSTASTAGTLLTQYNAVAAFSAVNSGSGDLTLYNSAAPLTLGNISEAGGNIVVKNHGSINQTGTIGDSGGTVTLLNTTAVPTTINLSAAPNPAVFGQALTLSATVVPFDATLGVPSGSVNFLDGSTLLGTVVLDNVAGNDTAVFTVSSLTVGSHALTAAYSGDGTFVTSTSAAVSQVIAKDQTTTQIVAASPNPVEVGNNITFTAVVTAAWPNTGAPAGTVQFLDGGTSLGTATLDGVAADDEASFTTDGLSAGQHTITAAYLGAAGYLASTSWGVAVTVLPPPPPPAPPPPAPATTTTLTWWTGYFEYYAGDPITLTARVESVSYDLTAPSGTVTFMDGTTNLGTVALSHILGHDAASLTISSGLSPVGEHDLTAVYSGDSTHATSTGELDVDASQVPVSLTLIDSPTGSSYVNQPVTLIAVAQSGDPLQASPSGNVDFTEQYIDTSGNLMELDLGTAPLGVSNGLDIATLTLSSLVPQGYNIDLTGAVFDGTIMVNYAGTSVFTQAESNQVQHRVSKIPVYLTAVTYGFDNGNVLACALAQTWDWYALSLYGLPTGDVTVSDLNGDVLASAPLEPQGNVALANLSFAPPSNGYVVFSYSGTNLFAPTTGAVNGGGISFGGDGLPWWYNSTDPYILIIPSQDPLAPGQPLTYTVFIESRFSWSISINFLTTTDFQNYTQLGSVSLSGDNSYAMGSVTFSDLTPGPRTVIEATGYVNGGSYYFFAGTPWLGGAAYSYQHITAPTTTQVFPGLDIYDPNGFPFVALVTRESDIPGFVPTGTVNFTDVEYQTTEYGSASLSAQGTYAVAAFTAPPPVDSIEADYEGDQYYAPSSSALWPDFPGIPTTLNISSSDNAANENDSITFTASVASVPAFAGLSGTVTFYDGNTDLGSANVSGASATASITVPASEIPTGADIVAQFTSDDGRTLDSSDYLTQYVVMPPPPPPPPPVIADSTGKVLVTAQGVPFSGTVAVFTPRSDARGSLAATIFWGDGSSSSGNVGSTSGGLFTVFGAHDYVLAGTYLVGVRVSDAYGHPQLLSGVAVVLKTGDDTELQTIRAVSVSGGGSLADDPSTGGNVATTGTASYALEEAFTRPGGSSTTWLTGSLTVSLSDTADFSTTTPTIDDYFISVWGSDASTMQATGNDLVTVSSQTQTGSDTSAASVSGNLAQQSYSIAESTTAASTTVETATDAAGRYTASTTASATTAWHESWNQLTGSLRATQTITGSSTANTTGIDLASAYTTSNTASSSTIWTETANSLAGTFAYQSQGGQTYAQTTTATDEAGTSTATETGSDSFDRTIFRNSAGGYAYSDAPTGNTTATDTGTALSQTSTQSETSSYTGSVMEMGDDVTGNYTRLAVENDTDAATDTSSDQGDGASDSSSARPNIQTTEGGNYLAGGRTVTTVGNSSPSDLATDTNQTDANTLSTSGGATNFSVLTGNTATGAYVRSAVALTTPATRDTDTNQGATASTTESDSVLASSTETGNDLTGCYRQSAQSLGTASTAESDTNQSDSNTAAGTTIDQSNAITIGNFLTGNFTVTANSSDNSATTDTDSNQTDSNQDSTRQAPTTSETETGNSFTGLFNVVIKAANTISDSATDKNQTVLDSVSTTETGASTTTESGDDVTEALTQTVTSTDQKSTTETDETNIYPNPGESRDDTSNTLTNTTATTVETSNALTGARTLSVTAQASTTASATDDTQFWGVGGYGYIGGALDQRNANDNGTTTTNLYETADDETGIFAATTTETDTDSRSSTETNQGVSDGESDSSSGKVVTNESGDEVTGSRTVTAISTGQNTTTETDTNQTEAGTTTIQSSPTSTLIETADDETGQYTETLLASDTPTTTESDSNQTEHDYVSSTGPSASRTTETGDNVTGSFSAFTTASNTRTTTSNDGNQSEWQLTTDYQLAASTTTESGNDLTGASARTVTAATTDTANTTDQNWPDSATITANSSSTAVTTESGDDVTGDISSTTTATAQGTTTDSDSNQSDTDNTTNYLQSTVTTIATGNDSSLFGETVIGLSLSTVIANSTDTAIETDTNQSATASSSDTTTSNATTIEWDVPLEGASLGTTTASSTASLSETDSNQTDRDQQGGTVSTASITTEARDALSGAFKTTATASSASTITGTDTNQTGTITSTATDTAASTATEAGDAVTGASSATTTGTDQNRATETDSDQTASGTSTATANSSYTATESGDDVTGTYQTLTNESGTTSGTATASDQSTSDNEQSTGSLLSQILVHGNRITGSVTTQATDSGATTMTDSGTDARGTFTLTEIDTQSPATATTSADDVTGSDTMTETSGYTSVLLKSGGNSDTTYSSSESDTHSQSVASSGDDVTGSASPTTTSTDSSSVVESGVNMTSGTTYTLTNASSSTATQTETSDDLTGQYTSTVQSSASSTLSETGTSSSGNYNLLKRTNDKQTVTETGDNATGDYTTATNDSNTSRAIESASHSGGPSTYTEVLTDNSTTTETGNTETGAYNRTVAESATANLDASGINANGTYTASDWSSGSATTTETGNNQTGVYTQTENASNNYGMTENNTNGSIIVTLTETGFQSYTQTENGNSITGPYTQIQSGTDSYTLAENGTLSGGTFTETVTGVDTYTTTETGNNDAGTFARTTTLSGTYARTESGPGATLGSGSGNTNYTLNESASSLAGNFQISETGINRYGLLEVFNGISNAGAGQAPGNLDFFPVGRPFVDPIFGYKLPWEEGASWDPRKSMVADIGYQGVTMVTDTAAKGGKTIINTGAYIVGSNMRVDFGARSAAGQALEQRDGRFFGQQFREPGDPRAAGFSGTVSTYAGAAGVAITGTASGAAAGAASGAATGAVAGGVTAGIVTGGAGIPAGAGAGAMAGGTSGAVWGGGTGFVSAMFSDGYADAAVSGAKGGAGAGALGGVPAGVGKGLQVGRGINAARAATSMEAAPALSKGDAFEASVKNTFRKKIIQENEVLRDSTGRVIGEIDFETTEAIAEVGISLKGKVDQLHKLAEVAAQRGKRLDVIYGPDTAPGTLEFLKQSLRKKWGNRVRFIPHE